jgi:VanZ family protein
VVSFLVRRFLKYWLPVIAWMVFIFIGSSDLLSAEHTSRYIGPFLRWFAPDISDPTIASVQLFVRKCGHLTEYAILAGLLFRALRRNPSDFRRAAVFGFLISAIYAALDEFHQSFVTSRTGSPFDVLIDCTGALVALVLCSLVGGAILRRRKTSP